MIRPKEISHFGLGEKGEQTRIREKRREKKKKKKKKKKTITGMEFEYGYGYMSWVVWNLSMGTDTCLGLYGN